MTRLIGFRRICGTATETRRCWPRAAMAAALAAATASAAIGFANFATEPAAWAQAAACQPASITAFDGEPVKGQAGAARLMIEACEPGRVDVNPEARDGVNHFQTQFGPRGSGFVSGISVNPCTLYYEGRDLPGTNLDVWVDTPTRAGSAFKRFTLAPDDEPPKITSVTPPSGTKVRPGQRLTIAVSASERYEDGHQSWQTGIKSIRVDDLTRHEGLPPWQNENPQPQPCGSKTWTKTHEMPFTVPDPAPAVVRLRVHVRDYQSPEVQQDIEYPTTGDWHGSFKWTHDCRGTMTDVTHGDSSLTLDYDGRGNLTGTLTGSTPQRSQTIPQCTMIYVAPGSFSAKLVGSYTPRPETFSVQATDVQTTPGRASYRCVYGNTVSESPFFTVFEGPIFRDAFRDLRRQPDGSLKLVPDGVRTNTVSATTCTTTYSLTLNRTLN